MKKIALFDLDGTLADDRHRIQFALDRRWFEYFDKHRVFADGVWPQGAQMLTMMEEEGYDIQYMTGRREDLRWTSLAWLAVNGFPVTNEHILTMRQFADHRPLADYKADAIQKILDAPDVERVVLFDDDPEVIRVVQERFGTSAGFHCTWYTKQKALVKKALA